MNDTQSLDNTQDTAPESPVSQQPVSETVAETLSRSLAELQPQEQKEDDNVQQDQENDNETDPEVSEEDSNSVEDGDSGDTEETESETSAEEEGKTEEKLEAPQHWSKEIKEDFNQLPSKSQQLFLKRHNQMEADYTKKTQALSKFRNRQEEVTKIISPFMGDFERAGIDEVGAIRQLFAAHDYLKKDPKQAIAWLATNYGVDLSAVNDDTAEDDYTDPEVKNLKQQVAQLQGYLQQQQNQQMQSEQQSTQSMIDQFANEKDETGTLKHPHFPEVRQVMGVLIQSQKAKDLPSAYEMAVYADPNLRKTMIDTQVKKASKSQVKTEAVQKAKKTQRSTVRGSATPAEQKLPGNLSIRETIQQSINQLQQGR